jgi:putative phosphoesterase
MRIGVLADTHIPDRTDELPVELRDLFQGIDLILHAGDVCVPSVLEQLETIAPVVAVLGNRDKDALGDLPEQTVIQAGDWRIGLIHGMRTRWQETPDRLRYVQGDHRFMDQRQYIRQRFAGDVLHCIVFGHSHQACNEVQDGTLLFNPGGVVRSPRGGPSSVGILETSTSGISGQIIQLQHPPRRITLAEELRRSWRRNC